MNEKRIHYDLIIAWANGAKIQVRQDKKCPWKDIETPAFHPMLEYRNTRGI